MAVIRHLFRSLMIVIKDAGRIEPTPRLPAAVEAERMALLLSCGF